jgi:hypothetical protein
LLPWPVVGQTPAGRGAAEQKADESGKRRQQAEGVERRAQAAGCTAAEFADHVADKRDG